MNINGFYDSLKVMIKTMVNAGFLKEENRKMLLINDDINDLIEKMNNYIAPIIGKRINKE